MNWFQIALIIYFGLNLILAVFTTIIFAIDGLIGKWWSWILFFGAIMIIGLPLAIIGIVEWLFDI